MSTMGKPDVWLEIHSYQLLNRLVHEPLLSLINLFARTGLNEGSMFHIVSWLKQKSIASYEQTTTTTSLK